MFKKNKKIINKKIFKHNSKYKLYFNRNIRDFIFRLINTDISVRDFVFLFFVLLALFTLIYRLLYLQFIDYDKYIELSQQNRYKMIKIDSERGNILDSKGRIIATNGMGYRLIYKKERDLNKDNIHKISVLTGFDEELIEKRIKYGEISLYLKENILFEDLDEELAHKLIEKIEENDLIEIQIYPKRRYIYDTVAAHTIGYVKKISDKEYEKLKEDGYTPRDIIGKSGVEKEYDKELKGKSGYKYIEVNAKNKIQSYIDNSKKENKGNIESIAAKPGKDLYLGIDMELQEYMENEFKKDNRSGAFIAINPKNGLIKTIVSYPTYSLNTFSSQISNKLWDEIVNNPQKPLTNKTIAGEYPPGSVFKVVSSIAFLDNGIDPKTKYLDATGYYQIGKWKWRAWKIGGHGYVDMKKSLVESANPYYYKLADQIGYKSIVEAANNLGLGNYTGIDVPGEKKGVVPTPDWKKKRIGSKWYTGDTILMSIGQGYTLVTPIQLAQAYSIIANKGYAYKPHVAMYTLENTSGIKNIISTEKYVVSKYDKSFYDILTDALKATVEQNNGTTKVLRNKNVSVAAKSGSAQNSASKLTHAWVAGFFPVENPEIVFVCLLEGAGSGGAVAGEMTKRFIDKYLEVEYNIVNEKQKAILD